MSKSYVIQWKSAINGRTGKGTKRFDFEEAKRLADELNREFPGIEHEPVEANPPTAESPGTRSLRSMEEPPPAEAPESGSENSQVTHEPAPVLLFH